MVYINLTNLNIQFKNIKEARVINPVEGAYDELRDIVNKDLECGVFNAEILVGNIIESVGDEEFIVITDVPAVYFIDNVGEIEGVVRVLYTENGVDFFV